MYLILIDDKTPGQASRARDPVYCDRQVCLLLGDRRYLRDFDKDNGVPRRFSELVEIKNGVRSVDFIGVYYCVFMYAAWVFRAPLRAVFQERYVPRWTATSGNEPSPTSRQSSLSATGRIFPTLGVASGDVRCSLSGRGPATLASSFVGSIGGPRTGPYWLHREGLSLAFRALCPRGSKSFTVRRRRNSPPRPNRVRGGF